MLTSVEGELLATSRRVPVGVLALLGLFLGSLAAIRRLASAGTVKNRSTLQNQRAKGEQKEDDGRVWEDPLP